MRTILLVVASSMLGVAPPVSAQLNGAELLARHNALVGGPHVLAQTGGVHLVVRRVSDWRGDTTGRIGQDRKMEIDLAPNGAFRQGVRWGMRYYPSREPVNRYPTDPATLSSIEAPAEALTRKFDGTSFWRVVVFDGDSAWEQSPVSRAAINEAAQGVARRESVECFPSIDPAELRDVSAPENVEVDGSRLIRVRATKVDGMQVTLDFERRSGLLRTVSESDANGRVTRERVFRDYRSMGGRRVAREVTITTPREVIRTSVLSLRWGPVDRSVFSRPSATASYRFR